MYRLTGDRPAASDIVQEVFFNFWTDQNTIHITESAEAYLYRSVMNRGLNYLRDEKRRKLILDESVLVIKF